MLGGSKWCRISSRTLISTKRGETLKAKMHRRTWNQESSGLRCSRWRNLEVTHTISQGSQVLEPYLCQSSFKSNVTNSKLTTRRWTTRQWWTLRNSLISKHQVIASPPSLPHHSHRAPRHQLNRELANLATSPRRCPQLLRISSSTWLKCRTSNAWTWISGCLLNKCQSSTLRCLQVEQQPMRLQARGRRQSRLQSSCLPQLPRPSMHQRSQRSWAARSDTTSLKPQKLGKQVFPNLSLLTGPRTWTTRPAPQPLSAKMPATETDPRKWN